jgi:RNA recognition motif-containing protein
MSWNIDEDWLRREFEGFGEIVGCRVITDRETGRAKGYVLLCPTMLDLLLTFQIRLR